MNAPTDGRTERQKLSPSAFLRKGGGQKTDVYDISTKKLCSDIIFQIVITDI